MSQYQSRPPARLLRAGLVASAVGAALLVAPQAAFAGANVGPSLVPPGGNATISDPSAAYVTANAAVQLSTTACPAKFTTTTSAGPWNAVVGNKSATAVSFTVPATGGPTPGPNGTVRLYYACLYDGAVATSSNLQGGGPIYVGMPVNASAFGGLTGGGNQLTVNANPTGPIFAGVNAVAAVFNSGPSCNASYGTANPSNLVATNVNRQSNTTVSFTVPSGAVAANGGAPTMYNICLYDASSATGSLLSFVPYNVNVVGVSPGSGSYLSTVGVTASSPIPFLSGVTMPAVVLLANAGCPGTYPTGPVNGATPMPITGPGAVRKLTNNRAAVTIPPLQLNNGQANTYQICFYTDGTANGNLVGTSQYTAGVVANPTGVIPAAGPAAGGNTITVVGSDFPTDPGRITATLGGFPLTNIQPISDKAFTAQAPAHAVEDSVTLVLSTPAGTKALPGAYAYLNPIKVSPNTAPSTMPTVDVDVQGSGFMSINFGPAGNAGRVFLVNGTYNGADAGGGVRANAPVAECVNVLAISDEELICTLQLNRRLNNTATGPFDSIGYNNSLTTDVSTTAGSRIITSTAGKFNANDVGQPIVQSGNSNIPQYSTVTSVLSPTKAVISAPASATSGSAFTAVIGNSVAVHTFTGALTTTAGSPTVTVSSGAFTRADIGRVFSSNTPGIPAGTTIVAVAPGGASATLSAAANASTQYTLANVTVGAGATTIASSAIATGDAGAVVGPNTVGIPVGTTISAVGSPGTSGTLSAAAVGGGTTASLALNKPVTATLYAAAPVPDGSYNLVVVSNGAPDAALVDPDYSQTDVTSSSAFTVASF